mgnify:CR=1 FL=1
MRVMTVSPLFPSPSPARREGSFVSRLRDFHVNAGSRWVLAAQRPRGAEQSERSRPCPPHRRRRVRSGRLRWIRLLPADDGNGFPSKR